MSGLNAFGTNKLGSKANIVHSEWYGFILDVYS